MSNQEQISISTGLNETPTAGPNGSKNSNEKFHRSENNYDETGLDSRIFTFFPAAGLRKSIYSYGFGRVWRQRSGFRLF